MRSEVGLNEELGSLRFSRNECVVAWYSRFGSHQRGETVGALSGLQDEQECAVCGHQATRSCGGWPFCQVPKDQSSEISLDIYCK